ncbi:C40 family peptidase [Streptomyces sp. AV19]|uniref:C40 family peptidase n=1 Tax=Streptomyces sp. AV19 TaxID=2793068 RepID=UPI0024139189|nr:C40 family peptidase [Streptomyces sp. AV19]MDG4535829.1 NlpC/P60 family protein [Streptomyces sp. AV19]
MRRLCAVLLTAAVTLSAPAPRGHADPPPGQSVSTLLGRLRTLHRSAEEATKAYEATDAKLRLQRAAVARSEEELARARTDLADSRDEAGRLAREQYRGTAEALSPVVTFLFTADPQPALDRRHELRRAAGRRAGTLGRLADGAQRISGLARRAREALDVQIGLAERKQKQRDTARGRLDEVEKLLAALTPAQLAELRRLEEHDVPARPLAGGPPPPPTQHGAMAVDFAYQQLGKPYVWGSAGPASFDCSGLTSQAWAHAGSAIPRTSQEQWRSLPKVPLDRLRPGDLVVYFQGATHVALYVGDGKVIQAPRPGTTVRLSPIAANPLLGAVRPDAGDDPLAPPLPVLLESAPALTRRTGTG